MNAFHRAIDGKHLSMCGKCTCSDKTLQFADALEQVTCIDCQKQITDFSTSRGKRQPFSDVD